MSFSPVWEQIHQQREWGKYPKEELVRWVAKHYYNRSEAERKATSFLDLGCACGANTAYLEQEGFSAVGIDGSESAIKRLPKGIMGVVADAIRLPFGTEAFDCVVDVVCIAHNTARDAKTILVGLDRVLKPGGRLFSIMPMPGCWFQPYEGKGNVIFPSRDQVMDLFSWFDVELEWSMASVQGNMLAHWLISGTKK